MQPRGKKDTDDDWCKKDGQISSRLFFGGEGGGGFSIFPFVPLF
jgi:hypothetical protein